MAELGKMLILIAVVLAVTGGLMWALGRSGFRGLPGDISYQGSNARFQFPIVTCLVLSLLLTAGMWLWRWLSGR